MVKTFLLWFLDNTGINALCRMLNRNKAIILWYHGVCSEGFDLLKGYDERHIPKTVFRRQLSYLKRKGYIFTSMSELLDIVKKKKRTNKLVVLTFDDGFLNVIQNGYPIMKEFGAKGCFYVVTDLIGTDHLLWTDQVETIIRNQKRGNFQFIFNGEKVDYKLADKRSYEYAIDDIKAKLRMISDRERCEHLKQFNNLSSDDIPKEFIMADWKLIKELDPNILEIGGHTRRHPDCVNLTSDKEIEDEIRHSKKYVEEKLNHEVKHFCYPAGSYNDRVITKVKDCGYESAVTVKHGFTDTSSDLYQLKRMGMTGQFLFFKASLSGSYYFLKRIKEIFT